MGIKKKLQKLWNEDQSYQKLTQVNFNHIGMRGVKDTSIEFNYPITAIAGANGIGKTTILQTIACLFHNTENDFQPYRFSNARIQLPYYRFTDFFVISRGEDKGLGVVINFKFIKQGLSRTEFSVKKISRWGNYERRPKRHVDFLGMSRVIPAHEFVTFKNTFAGSYTILENSSLGTSDRKAVGNITGKSFSNIEEHSCSSIKNFKLGKMTASDGLEYSSFNMGAGEEVAITLISRIHDLPEGSLILIEEIELGLHPRAQKELISSLMKVVYKKKLQLVFTTHSPYIFDVLPPEAKLLLKKSSDKLEVIQKPSNSLAFIELTGSDHKDLSIYVEDEIAKQLVETLFNVLISKRIQIIDVGSKENVIRLTAAHYINDQLGLAIGIPDGDATDSEIKNWCSKYMLKSGEECTAEEFQSRKSSYFENLPSTMAPEKYILDKMNSDPSFLNDIDDSEEFANFIHNQIDIIDDHHALFYKIAQFLSKDDEGIKRDILRYVSRNYTDEFQQIINLVNTKLGAR